MVTQLMKKTSINCGGKNNSLWENSHKCCCKSDLLIIERRSWSIYTYLLNKRKLFPRLTLQCFSLGMNIEERYCDNLRALSWNSIYVLVASKVSEEEAHMKLMAFRPVRF